MKHETATEPVICDKCHKKIEAGREYVKIGDYKICIPCKNYIVLGFNKGFVSKYPGSEE